PPSWRGGGGGGRRAARVFPAPAGWVATPPGGFLHGPLPVWLATMDSVLRRQLGIKFGRHRLSKDELPAEIAAIPADTPITVLPPGGRPSLSVAQAHANLLVNNLTGEVPQFRSRAPARGLSPLPPRS